jgi:hypothetical protein
MSVVVKPSRPKPVAVIRDGTYPAAVTGIRQFANSFGERIGFEFTILSGQYKGEKVMRSTAPQLTRQSKLSEVITGVIGRELTEKELENGYDLEELVDQACNILVITSKSRAGVTYSNVERVFAA